ncbi:MAG: hypothetical protein AAF845_18535, partial [Bacteroidota bacterium]
RLGGGRRIDRLGVRQPGRLLALAPVLEAARIRTDPTPEVVLNRFALPPAPSRWEGEISSVGALPVPEAAL